MDIAWSPSPNHDERGGPADILLLHYTGMKDGAAAVWWLCNPDSRVSSHYFVGEDGAVIRMVEEDRRAWHAGRSHWAGETDINARSIGIEIHNPGHEHGYRPFPEPQIEAVTALCREILDRHAIAPYRVLGHSDVAPARKEDPGELFPWARLAGDGVGLWPAMADMTADADPAAFEDNLRRYGYGLAGRDENGATLEEVTIAFQRHFRPARVDGVVDAETATVLEAVLAARERIV